MDELPGEILGQVFSAEVLTTSDLAKIALVNHKFHTHACARLYRTGELSYAGATDKDAAKVEAFSRNGNHVRNLKLHLFPRWQSGIDVPKKIWEIIRNFVNLHSLKFVDTGTLSWDDFTRVIAHIITSHPYLKVLEIQRTMLKEDGWQSIARAREILNDLERVCKLNSFTLKLSKKEDPQLISRNAMNDLIEILGKSAKSATAFSYAADCPESSEIDEKTAGKATENLHWSWDNLEDLALKLKHATKTSPFNSQVGEKVDWSFQNDLHNVKSLTLRAGLHDFTLYGSQAMGRPISSLSRLERVRLCQRARFFGWDPKWDSQNPFSLLAKQLPSLSLFEVTDPYYMMSVVQAWQIVRTDLGEITYKDVDLTSSDLLRAWD